ncbi:hypothetical protein NGB36_25850 [Streptomyces sp. RB6PN25]|uniref:Uncharacterized protein n=1 Tax=Streptomyces humicola TaxID=2953240 RepID=A0ABT1Q216_9ACTN|nr:hypothetical protein [Streptomyces humicola]MCQ4083919.1 hypothetical protein [Streptomyces humicola]
MIPGLHRLKGGAPQLGSEEPGMPGPFGTWPDGDGRDDPAEPAPDDAGSAGPWC